MTHPRYESVIGAQADIAVKLNDLQREHSLTNVEMLQAVTSWQGTVFKYMLRAERHPEDPHKSADEE